MSIRRTPDWSSKISGITLLRSAWGMLDPCFQAPRKRLEAAREARLDRSCGQSEYLGGLAHGEVQQVTAGHDLALNDGQHEERVTERANHLSALGDLRRPRAGSGRVDIPRQG